MTNLAVPRQPTLTLMVLMAGLLTVAGGIMAWWQGVYNWDLVAYTAVVLEYRGVPPSALHQATFSLLQQQFPADVFKALTSGEAYNIQCFQDPDYFIEQLGFYRVKPLFTGMVYGGMALGLPLRAALVLPALLGYVALGILSFWWCSRLLPTKGAFVSVLLLMLSFPLLGVRLITPDALSAAAVVAFLAGLRFGWHRAWLVLLAALLITIRIDHILLPVVWVVLVLISGWQHIQWPRVAVLLLALVVLALVLPMLWGNGPLWFLQYRFTQSGKEYLVQMANSIRQFSGTMLPVLVVLIAIAWPYADALWRKILLTMGVVIGLRWLLFPVMQERFFLGYEMVGLLFLLEVLKQMRLINRL